MHLEELPCTVLTVVVTANVRDMDDICFVYCKYYLVRQELSSQDPFALGIVFWNSRLLHSFIYRSTLKCFRK